MTKSDFCRGRQGLENLQSAFPNALIVPKEKISENGDYNLSGERYREVGEKPHIFPLVGIGEVCTINPRKSQLADLKPDTRISFAPMADLNEHCIAFQPSTEKLLSEVSTSYTYFKDNDVLLAKVTPCFENGKAGIAHGLINGIGFGSSEFYVLRSSKKVLPEWIYFCVMHPIFRDAAIAQMTGTGGLQRVPRDYVENFKIPLPPLAVQKEIVAEIEGYQKVIDGARTVLDNYRPHIPIHPDWPVVELGVACDAILTGPFGTALHQSDYVTEGIPVINPKNIVDGTIIKDGAKQVSPETRDNLKEFTVRANDVIIGRRGEMGRCAVVTSEMNGWLCGTGCFVIRLKTEFDARFAFFQIASQKVKAYLEEQAVGVTMMNLNQGILSSIQIPLPALAEQEAIVAEIEAEQKLVDANRELITRFEQKIQSVLARIWGEAE